MRALVAATCAALVIPLVASGCSAPSTGGDATPDRLVLADSTDLGEFNPVAGYSATGVSPLYEGLLRPSAEDDTRLPTLEPALAASDPVISDDGRTWTVTLRDGIHFHDGTDLDSGDVAATYRAVTDPASASPSADDYTLIDHIDTPDESTIVFHLDAPNREFSSRLLLGIAPGERLTGGPATESSLNTEPVGTGPYRLDALSPTEATLSADPDHRDGAPAVTTVIIRSVPDENTRAQLLLTGEIDGAPLPPRLAAGLDGRNGISVVSANSADWRGVSLPMSDPFASDPAARRAMNVAVDRDAIVDQVLAGEGQPATTPITDAYPEHVPIEFGPDDPAARTARAGELLSDAGWEPGPDGIRTKNGARAELSVAYHADDSVRRELAAAFADQMRPLGIAVEPRGTSWDEIEANADSAAILLAGGDNPYTIDTQARRALHSRTPASGPFDNPGGYRNPALDAALDRLREPGNRTPADELYQDVQRAYGDDPGYVIFATMRHTYAVRDTGHTGPAPILEPHTHGVTWGPWWALSQWTPRP